MNRDEALSLLEAHRDDIASFGIRSLALFGSVARDEAGPESDVDVLVEFDDPLTFARYMNLKLYLEDLLGRRVDLIDALALKPRARPYVERELIRVAVA
jgi:predicted nucleotidyltransferase